MAKAAFDTPPRRATLIAFAGLPGAGKTSVARALADELGAIYLRVDSIEAALKNSSLRIHPAEDAGYRALLAVARDNLVGGRIVIADTVNPLRLTRAWFAEIALERNARLINVEVVCSDAGEHRRRVTERCVQSEEAPTWDQVCSQRYEAWAGDRLILDTSRTSVADCVVKIREALPAD